MKSGLIYQSTCHLDQINPLVIWHLFVDLPRTPKEAGILGYHKIPVFASIYSQSLLLISFHLLSVFAFAFSRWYYTFGKKQNTDFTRNPPPPPALLLARGLPPVRGPHRCPPDLSMETGGHPTSA